MELVELVEINERNRSFYQTFDLLFEADLNQYQSRIYPNKTAETLKWYDIAWETEIIGSVWFEKEQSAPYAVLGILIADKGCRGKGSGRRAIRLIVKRDAFEMGIQEIRLTVREKNERACRCYCSLGFRETGRFVNPAGIPAISMRLPIHPMLRSEKTMKKARRYPETECIQSR